MDEEIKQLRARLQELEQKKKEEEERNKDPFRYLRERIEHWRKQLNTNRSNLAHVEYVTREMNCDLSILQALEKLQADVEALRTAPVENLLG